MDLREQTDQPPSWFPPELTLGRGDLASRTFGDGPTDTMAGNADSGSDWSYHSMGVDPADAAQDEEAPQDEEGFPLGPGVRCVGPQCGAVLFWEFVCDEHAHSQWACSLDCFMQARLAGVV